ncbi:hypothetical protein FACS1894216_11770 [Synergistales bacterium]|nr:hypothetical protein FACS1894216_11770 [Synergistales bacterium]
MKVSVYGAGANAEILLRKLADCGTYPQLLCDSDSNKQGTQVCGYIVQSPEVLRMGCDLFIIVSVFSEDAYNEIKQLLIEKGFEEGKDFVRYSVFFGGELTPLDVLWGQKSGYKLAVSDMAGNEYISHKGYDTMRLYSGNGKIVRVANGKPAQLYRDVLTKLLTGGGEILGKYIVGTKISEQLKGDFVVEHEYIKPIIYACEFSPLMFYDYTKFIIDLMEKIDSVGLFLCDMGTFNGTFNKGNFILIDFPAVIDGKMGCLSFSYFLMLYVNILHLFAKGHFDKAYLYMRNIRVHCTFGDIKGLLSLNEISEYESMSEICLDQLRKGDISKCCEHMRNYVDKIPLKQVATPWLGYQKKLYASRLAESDWTNKQKTVINWIKSENIKTMIDLAGNEGFFSLVLSDSLDYAISADLDHACVDDLYKSIMEKKIKNVIPAYINIVTATPPFFRGENCGDSPIRPFLLGTRERFKCDCVLALAVLHHLVMQQCLDFVEIINLLSSYTTRYMIVEFIDRTDSTLYNISSDFDWYSRENFETELAKQSFSILDVKLSSPETRLLYFLDKQSNEQQTKKEEINNENRSVWCR